MYKWSKRVSYFVPKTFSIVFYLIFYFHFIDDNNFLKKFDLYDLILSEFFNQQRLNWEM